MAEGIRHGERKHKDRLNKEYLNALNRLIELLKHKTNYLENNNNTENFDSIIEHYQLIDNQCQSSLDELDQNHQLTSSVTVIQFVEGLEGLENRTKDTVLKAIITKLPIL